MSFVMNLVLVAQILSALGMVGLILVQHGRAGNGFSGQHAAAVLLRFQPAR